MKKSSMDFAFWSIVAIGPVLWLVDSFAIAVLFKTDFLRQLFFPRSFDLVLCILLLFFPLLVAVLFHPRPPAQEKQEEQKEIEEIVRKEEMLKSEKALQAFQQKADQRVKELEAGFAQELSSKLLLERKNAEGLVRQEEQKKAQDTIAALQQKFESQLQQARTDEAARAAESIRLQERKDAAEQVKILQAGFVLELESKLALERKRVEELVRMEEQKKARDASVALQRTYESQLRAGVEDENRRVAETVRLEEQKKTEERVKSLETKLLLEFESKLVDERKRIEETVRDSEQKKAEAAVRALRQKYDELIKSGQGEDRKRMEDLVRMEEQKKMGEQILALDAKYAQQISSRIAEERKHIEDTIRMEEQKKAEEAIRALRQRYEDQPRSGMNDQKLEEARHALEDKYATEFAKSLAQERSKIEAALKSEMEKKAASVVAQQAHVSAVSQQASVSSNVKIPEMNRLVNGLSQQILNPLGGVLNNIKLVKIKMLQGGDLKAKEIKEAFDMVEENAFLCKNILSSMSLLTGSSHATFGPMSLNTVISKINSLMGHELKLQNISINKVLQENLPQISGDPWLMTQVVFNIVANAKWAIKSNPMAAVGTITITTQASPQMDRVELIISDNGIGISEDNIAHIFEPFFTTKQDGLGLGLAVAQNIIKEHNGDIQVDSKEDKGATFKISLPAVS